jgi:hypothetical protein
MKSAAEPAYFATSIVFRAHASAHTYHQLPGYLHGLLANETEAVCERCVPWMQRVIANREREPAAALPGVAGDVVRDRI